MKQYAVFSNDDSDYLLIQNVLDYFKNKHKFIDYNIFTDNIIYSSKNISVLSAFYMRFYSGNLIFLRVQDLLKHKDSLLSSSIFLHTSIDALLNNNVDKQALSNISLLSTNNGEIYEI